jgi:hypothetical protein
MRHLENMEVDLTEQRGRLPVATGVAALDQPEQRRLAGLEQLWMLKVRMTARDEVVGTDHREAHGVLMGIRNPASTTVPDDEEAGVGRGIQRTIPRVDAEAVDMNEAGVVGDRRRGRGRTPLQPTGGQRDQQRDPKANAMCQTAAGCGRDRAGTCATARSCPDAPGPLRCQSEARQVVRHFGHAKCCRWMGAGGPASCPAVGSVGSTVRPM